MLFDLDGVITPTAAVHAAAWKRTFDAFLRERDGADAIPFSEDDYLRFVDGRPRYDGVRTFLASRGVHLDEGAPSDQPGFDTVCAIGNTKNEMFNRVLADEGVEPYPGSIALLDHLDTIGVPSAIVSSSANARAVLDAAGIASRFVGVVDGVVSRRLGLTGKPAPDAFLIGAEELGVDPSRAVVVEDAVSGVAAGRAGGFGLVLGVARLGEASELEAAGADVVVADLGEVTPAGPSRL